MGLPPQPPALRRVQRVRVHHRQLLLIAALALGCGYRTRAITPQTVTLGDVRVLDPDPTLVALGRAALVESLVREGISLRSGDRLDVSIEAPQSSAPAGAFVTELRAEVVLRATLSGRGRSRTMETRGEGEAPVGERGASAAEAARWARRRAIEMAAERLAEALRVADE